MHAKIAFRFPFSDTTPNLQKFLLPKCSKIRKYVSEWERICSFNTNIMINFSQIESEQDLYIKVFSKEHVIIFTAWKSCSLDT